MIINILNKYVFKRKTPEEYLQYQTISFSKFVLIVFKSIFPITVICLGIFNFLFVGLARGNAKYTFPESIIYSLYYSAMHGVLDGTLFVLLFIVFIAPLYFVLFQRLSKKYKLGPHEKLSFSPFQHREVTVGEPLEDMFEKIVLAIRNKNSLNLQDNLSDPLEGNSLLVKKISASAERTMLSPSGHRVEITLDETPNRSTKINIWVYSTEKYVLGDSGISFDIAEYLKQAIISVSV